MTTAAQIEKGREQIRFDNFSALRDKVGGSFTPWGDGIRVTETMIQAFVAVSGEDHWIHTNRERSRSEGPFGDIIAPTSLIVSAAYRSGFDPGFDITNATVQRTIHGTFSVLGVVPVDTTIHSRSRFLAVANLDAFGTRLTFEFQVRREGHSHLVLSGEISVLYNAPAK
ncbi:MAG: MaoC family dehydratase [Patescibacteria group bacterium]